MVVTGTPQPTTAAEYTSNQIGYLEDRIRRIAGDSDSDKWTHADIMDTIEDSMDMFNEDGRIAQRYEILGSDNNRYFNPVMTSLNRAIMCYFTAIALLTGAKSKASRVSISFSNPAGSTNLTSVPRDIKDSINIIKSQLNALIEREWRKLIEDNDMSVAEMTTQG